ncbi:MAG: signal peptidase I [Mycobacteriales bacterium]
MADQRTLRDLVRRPGKEGKKRLPFWQELPILAVTAVVLALIIKTFLVQTFYIPSGSMENTLHLQDRVLVNKVVYDLRTPRRGEIVVFTSPDWGPDQDYIKRVIGLPGDTVQCCDARGRVMVNGKPIDEPYIFQNNPMADRSFDPVKVPSGRLWVMGDHRGQSGDSRAHVEDRYSGTIATDHVVGRAFAIVWPPSRMTTLSVPESLK